MTQRWSFLAWLMVLGFSGCAFVRPPRIPIEQKAHAPFGPARARGVIVLLPGFGDSADDFEEHGFVRTLRARAPDYDVVATEAHFGYYRKGILVERLEADVVAKLRAQGYREIWLAGASMGGFGAVGFARKHPERIAGLLLFAPYMGPTDILMEAKNAGGLCAWQSAPVAKEVDRATFARANLLWLKQQACNEGGLPIYVGVGASDRLLPADEVLYKELGEDHVQVLPGGHGWKVWTPLLDVLAQRAFTRGGGGANGVAAP